MGSFDNKDERVARFCDRADENFEKSETASGAVRRVGMQARASLIESSRPGLSRFAANAVPTSVHRRRTPATPATQHKPAFRSDSTGGTLIDTAAKEL